MPDDAGARRCRRVPSLWFWVVDGADWTAGGMPAAKNGTPQPGKGGAICKASAAGLWSESDFR